MAALSFEARGHLAMLAFSALGVHILMGGAFEFRTLAAMVLRSLVWIAIAFTACRYLLAARAAKA